MPIFDITRSAHQLISEAFDSKTPTLQPKSEEYHPNDHEVCGEVPLTIQNLYMISQLMAESLTNFFVDDVTQAKYHRLTQKKKVIDQLISCEMVSLFKKPQYFGLVLLDNWKVAGILEQSRFAGYQQSRATQVEIA